MNTPDAGRPGAAGAGRAERFQVRMTLRDGGPCAEGTWAERAVALVKFRSWTHGSREGVTITLTAEAGGTQLRTWTKARSEEIHRANRPDLGTP
ncbi:hypothetical protein ACWGI9_42850 [Streptomyces sp. NPDC054833]